MSETEDRRGIVVGVSSHEATNRRGFFSRIIGAIGALSFIRLSPAASAIPPTCTRESPARIDFVEWGGQSEWPVVASNGGYANPTISRKAINTVNIGNWSKYPPNVPIPDVYGEWSRGAVGGSLVATLEVSE